MQLPARSLFVHHSVTAATGDPVRDMRAIERIGRERFGRFSYSYAAHPDGALLEGAGTTIGAHTAGHNSAHLAVVLIGNYERDDPTAVQLEAVAQLTAHLVEAGRLVASDGGDVLIRPHRAVAQTACPGAKTVPHLAELRTRVAQLLADPGPHDPDQEDDDVPKIVWAGDHAYHVAGVTAVHIQQKALDELRRRGLKEEKGWDPAVFADAHVIVRTQ